MRAQDEGLLRRLSVYLNFHADAVTEADVRALADEFSLPDAQAFALLLAGALGLDAAESEADARIVREDLPRMLHPLDAAAYARDPYARALRAALAREENADARSAQTSAASRAALGREENAEARSTQTSVVSRAALGREENAEARSTQTSVASRAALGREENAEARSTQTSVASRAALAREKGADARSTQTSAVCDTSRAALAREESADACSAQTSAVSGTSCEMDAGSRSARACAGSYAAGTFALSDAAYRPYELFVADDLRAYPDGAVLPVLGYFTRPFTYPVLTENGREWMTATPNEINTIRPVAEAAHGRVLTLGLGLGYFAFHALLNPRVESVTAVERSEDAIRLFRERLLPLFPRAERLTLLHADAFDVAPALYRSGKYDFVFADLWHDVGDGLPMYERLKRMEVPGLDYHYWIEKTLEFYR